MDVIPSASEGPGFVRQLEAALRRQEPSPSTLFLSPFARRESARDDKKWFWEDRAVFIELMFALKAVRAAAFERNRFRHLQKRAGRVRKTGRLAVDQPQFPVKT